MSNSISPDMLAGTVVTTRIRLARNLKGFPFKIQDVVTAKNVVKKVNRALVKAGTFNLYYMSNLDAVALEAMKERHLISVNLMQNVECGAVLVSDDESVSVMVNEEDVIREQCFKKGLRLTETYREIQRIDDELSKTLDFAFDRQFGYLTACPTNLGTGMRASVMMFLPALSVGNKIKALRAEAEESGLTVRGLYGEGSKSEGYMYQISNEVTLGVSEEEILEKVERVVLSVCMAERRETERLFGKNQLKTMDLVKKSFGILTNAVLLPYNEFLGHIANVKLGAMLGMINMSEPQKLESLDDLIVFVRPANLCEYYKKDLTSLERDLYRAEIVGKKLVKLRDE